MILSHLPEELRIINSTNIDSAIRNRIAHLWTGNVPEEFQHEYRMDESIRRESYLLYLQSLMMLSKDIHDKEYSLRIKEFSELTMKATKRMAIATICIAVMSILGFSVSITNILLILLAKSS